MIISTWWSVFASIRAAYRLGHRTGNRMLTGFLASTFGHTFKDILSGYRVFSRRFVKSFPVLSDSFAPALGVVGARARHGDARAAGNEDAGLPVPTSDERS